MIGKLVHYDVFEKGQVNEIIQYMMKLEKENEELKQQLSDIDKLINDLGSEEMCRQYDEIIGDFE